jgi:hypothetical protein
MLSRRAFVRFLSAGFLAARVRGGAPKRRADLLRLDRPFPRSRTTTRRYRADAVISLLGVHIFSRRDVGRGTATLRESKDGDRQLVGLEFAGGSIPERCHGVYYCGSSEESVVACSSVPQEAAYFGFVSAAVTESYEQARQRVLANKQTLSRYVIVEGSHEPGCARYEKGSVELPATDVADISDLIAELRERFSQVERSSQVFRERDSSTQPTFLYSVLTALRSGKPRIGLDYVHNARRYRLECESASDPRMGGALAEKKLTDRAGAVTRLTGRVRDLETGHVSTFRLWLDDSSELPLRIEFEPRSYLRIALEYEPALNAATHAEEDR